MRSISHSIHLYFKFISGFYILKVSSFSDKYLFTWWCIRLCFTLDGIIANYMKIYILTGWSLFSLWCWRVTCLGVRECRGTNKVDFSFIIIKKVIMKCNNVFYWAPTMCQVLSSENRCYLSHYIDEVAERLRQFSICQGYITSSMPASLTPCPVFFIRTDSRGRGWKKNLQRVPLVTSIIHL